jgi:DNA polymerase-4
MTRNIIHLDLDCFFVACEVLRNSALKNKPVLIGGQSDRAVVASCSYEARAFGVRSAMPMRYARQLCPDALIIRGDMDLYSNYSKLVTTVIRESVPALEKASVDEFYVDMTGVERLSNCFVWAGDLVQTIHKETGLTISCGLSINKTVSKMATNECKPNGRLEVPPPRVQPFLNPLSVAKIPQIGQKTFATLSRIGIRRIQTLAEMPVEFMERLLGQNGKVIWERANGIDERPIVPYSEQKSISAERTFERDTIDISYVKSLLIQLTEDLAFELRKAQKLTSIVTVKLRYANFDTHTRQKSIAYAAGDRRLIETVQELFDQLYERRMLIRLVGVKFSGLVSGRPQINLFDDSAEMIALDQAMDRVKRKFGKGAIRRAGSSGDFNRPA